MRTKKAASEDVTPMRPTLSPEVRENQMISLAMDLVEKRLREGTASSAETTHFLKLATVKSELEKNAVLYKEAIQAMREYGGVADDDEQQDLY